MFFAEKLMRNKTVLVNFSYLSILQIFTIVFPLLTYPYLLRMVIIYQFTPPYKKIDKSHFY